MADPMVMMTFRLDVDTYSKLLVQAEIGDRTMSDIIRDALQKELS